MNILDLGYTGTTEKVFSQIVDEFKQLNDERERLMFAEKIAGKIHMGNFMISAQ